MQGVSAVFLFAVVPGFARLTLVAGSSGEVEPARQATFSLLRLKARRVFVTRGPR